MPILRYANSEALKYHDSKSLLPNLYPFIKVHFCFSEFCYFSKHLLHGRQPPRYSKYREILLHPAHFPDLNIVEPSNISSFPKQTGCFFL